MAVSDDNAAPSGSRTKSGPSAGKVVIVTGGASGIGLATSRRFARDGAHVVIADKEDEAGQAAAKDLGDRGRSVMFVHCDVSQRLDVLNLMAAVIEAHDRVDVLVNNAGVGEKVGFLDLDEAEFDRIVGVNLKGGFLVGQAVARQMIDQLENADPSVNLPPGAIINMSSVNAVFSRADRVIYSMTKAGLQSLTKGMALALAPHGIRVNAIGPGSISTEMTEEVLADEVVRKKILSRTPLGRIGTAKEIASVAAFLASNDASYITGQTIFVDGGRLPLHYTVEPTGS